ncbi:MAG: hypothetical protein ABI867_31450, partial [Kofleriaceae bacterium]
MMMNLKGGLLIAIASIGMLGACKKASKDMANDKGMAGEKPMADDKGMAGEKPMADDKGMAG